MSVRFFSIFLSVFLVACGGSGSNSNDPKNNTQIQIPKTNYPKRLVFTGKTTFDQLSLEGFKVRLYSRNAQGRLVEKGFSFIRKGGDFSVSYLSSQSRNPNESSNVHIIELKISSDLVLYSVAKDNHFKINLIEHFKAAMTLSNSSQRGVSVLHSNRYTQTEYETVYLPKIVQALKALSQERGVQYYDLINGIFEGIKSTGSMSLNNRSVALHQPAAKQLMLLLNNNPNLKNGIHRRNGYVFNMLQNSRYSVYGEKVEWNINSDFLVQDLPLKGLQINSSDKVRAFFLSLYQGNQSGIKINSLSSETPVFNSDWDIYFNIQNRSLYSELTIYFNNHVITDTPKCGSGRFIERHYLEDERLNKLTLDKKWLNVPNKTKVQLSAIVTDVLGNTRCLTHNKIYTIRNDKYELIDSYPKPNGFVLSNTKKPFLVLKTDRPIPINGHSTKYRVLRKNNPTTFSVLGEGPLKLTNTKQTDGSYLVNVSCYSDCADFFKLQEGALSFEFEIENLKGTIPFTVNRKQPVITVTSDDPATHRCKDVKGRCKVTKGQGHSGALIKVGSGGIGNDPHDTWRRDTFKLDARVDSLRLKSWRFYIPAKYLKSGIEYEKVFDTKPTTHNKYQYQTSFKFDTNLLKDGHSIPFNFEAVDEANRTTLKTVLIHVDHDSRNLKMYFKTQMHRIPDKGISALQRLYDRSSYLYNEMYHSDILLLDEFAINTPPVHSKKEFKGEYRILLCTKGSVLSSFVFYVQVQTNNRTPIVSSAGEAFGYFAHKRGGISLFRPPPEVFDFTTPVPHEVCRPVQVGSNNQAEGDTVNFKFEINNLYGDKSTIRSSHINKRY